MITACDHHVTAAQAVQGLGLNLLPLLSDMRAAAGARRSMMGEVISNY